MPRSFTGMSLFTHKTEVAADRAFPGSNVPMGGLGPHRVLGTLITPPFPEGAERIVVGMGCFWGAERLF